MQERADHRARADDDARLHDHVRARDLHGPARRGRPRAGDARRASAALERRATARAIGVMPRGGSDADVRWFEVDPCYVFHPSNAWTDGKQGRVRRRATRVDVAHEHERLRAQLPPSMDVRPRDRHGAAKSSSTTAATRSLASRTPRSASTTATRTWSSREPASSDAVTSPGVIAKWDNHASVRPPRTISAPMAFPDEPVFVPSESDGAEDDGYVLVVRLRPQLVTRATSHILDASRHGRVAARGRAPSSAGARTASTAAGSPTPDGRIAMGLFNRMKDPVEGMATVVSSTGPS